MNVSLYKQENNQQLCYLTAHMDNDLLPFLAGVGLLILYLIFSASTEMGTKLPWKK
ncbi:MAG TPA: hypothetical protein V6D09_26685 [Leptolyngbyaceae cyanobacterium]